MQGRDVLRESVDVRDGMNKRIVHVLANICARF